ncbi:GTP 3',8-cyclase MoaA [Georgenia sp. Z1344]|uniref:GTP 3',8-cyclase MoaA n=1 Tax=Georgenia sp. Z1344 TaxID=3416706 RepID=UPI003CFA109E
MTAQSSQAPVLLPVPTVPSAADRGTTPGTPLPAGARGLPDRFGRRATDLRVSLTDRCNLRCTYCMPAEGLDWLPTPDVLTDEEVVRLVTIAVRDLGVRTVRFTGGEPLLRRGLEHIIAGTAALRDHDGNKPDIALTTNALGLDKRIDSLVDAGLDRVNISIDSLDRERYAAAARRDRLHDALRSLDAVDRVGIRPVKINAVPQAGSYREDAPELLRFCLERGYQLRFIEYMPIGPRESWKRGEVVTAQDLRDALTDAGFTLTQRPGPRGSAPAEVEDVTAPGLPDGTVGLVASVSEPFCAACTRTRITADGQVRSCLFATEETDLRGLLRDGSDDAAVSRRWQEAMWGKPRAHGFGTDDSFAAPSRTMSAIGG